MSGSSPKSMLALEERGPSPVPPEGKSAKSGAASLWKGKLLTWLLDWGEVAWFEDPDLEDTSIEQVLRALDEGELEAEVMVPKYGDAVLGVIVPAVPVAIGGNGLVDTIEEPDSPISSIPSCSKDTDEAKSLAIPVEGDPNALPSPLVQDEVVLRELVTAETAAHDLEDLPEVHVQVQRTDAFPGNNDPVPDHMHTGRGTLSSRLAWCAPDSRCQEGEDEDRAGKANGEHPRVTQNPLLPL